MEKMNCVKRSISLLVAMCMFGGCYVYVWWLFIECYSGTKI